MYLYLNIWEVVGTFRGLFNMGITNTPKSEAYLWGNSAIEEILWGNRIEKK